MSKRLLSSGALQLGLDCGALRAWVNPEAGSLPLETVHGVAPAQMMPQTDWDTVDPSQPTKRLFGEGAAPSPG